MTMPVGFLPNELHLQRQAKKGSLQEGHDYFFLQFENDTANTEALAQNWINVLCCWSSIVTCTQSTVQSVPTRHRRHAVS